MHSWYTICKPSKVNIQIFLQWNWAFSQQLFGCNLFPYSDAQKGGLYLSLTKIKLKNMSIQFQMVTWYWTKFKQQTVFALLPTLGNKLLTDASVGTDCFTSITVLGWHTKRYIVWMSELCTLTTLTSYVEIFIQWCVYGGTSDCVTCQCGRNHNIPNTGWDTQARPLPISVISHDQV